MQWTRPKSVRQIGEIPGRGRIYMEDYVIRFVKRLAEQSHGMEKAAVLLGTSLILGLHLFGNEGKFYGFGNCRMVLQLSGIFC